MPATNIENEVGGIVEVSHHLMLWHLHKRDAVGIEVGQPLFQILFRLLFTHDLESDGRIGAKEADDVLIEQEMLTLDVELEAGARLQALPKKLLAFGSGLSARISFGQVAFSALGMLQGFRILGSLLRRSDLCLR